MSVPTARTAQQAQDDMLAIQPSGFAAARDANDYAAARFTAAADAFVNVETAALALLPELIDPRSASDMLPEWVGEMDLPTWMGDLSQYTDATKRDVAFALLSEGVPVCAGDWERFALLIGETITVQEAPPSIWGGFKWGAVTMNPVPGDRQVLVNAGSVVVSPWRWGGSVYGERYGAFEPSKIEPIMRAGVPIDVQLTFSYRAA